MSEGGTTHVQFIGSPRRATFGAPVDTSSSLPGQGITAGEKLIARLCFRERNREVLDGLVDEVLAGRTTESTDKVSPNCPPKVERWP